MEKINLNQEGYIFKSEEELKQFLENKNIDLSSWGKGQAKTLGHLFSEINAGEAIISVDANDRVVRTIWPLKVNVKYVDGNLEYTLVEQHQIFLDDTGRMRERDLPYAVNEKLKKGEDPYSGVMRALNEELGITGQPASVDREDVYVDPKESDSYPGLISKTTVYPYSVYLNKEQFNPSGYVEKQKDKMTCFTWIRKDF